MSFLFNHHQYFLAPCVVADGPRTGADIGIGLQLWERLMSGSSGRACLALKPAKGAHARRFPSLVCWGTLDEKVSHIISHHVSEPIPLSSWNLPVSPSHSPGSRTISR